MNGIANKSHNGLNPNPDPAVLVPKLLGKGAKVPIFA